MPLKNVLIIGKGNNAKDTVRTNKQGVFEIANISGRSYKIGIEKDGYSSQEYQVLDLKEFVNIDTITLHTTDYHLHGATIKAKRQIFESNRRIIIPSQKQKEKC